MTQRPLIFTVEQNEKLPTKTYNPDNFQGINVQGLQNSETPKAEAGVLPLTSYLRRQAPLRRTFADILLSSSSSESLELKYMIIDPLRATHVDRH